MKDMWDVLYEAPTWRAFFKKAFWWLRHGATSFRFRLAVVIHAARERLK